MRRTLRRSAPAQTHRQGSLLRRLDEAAGWVNPFLMAVAALLLVLVMSGVAIRLLPRLGVTHIGDPTALAAPDPSVNVPMPPS